MRLNEMAVAKAVATVNAVVFAVCWLWTKVSANSLVWLGNLWAHSVDLSAIPMKKVLTLETGVVGLVTWTLFAGLMSYWVAWIYNRMVKK